MAVDRTDIICYNYFAANQKNDNNRDDVVPEAGGIKNAGPGPVATSGVGVAAGSISADTEPEKKDKKAPNNNTSNEPWKSIIESSSAVNTTKGLKPNQYQQYENTLTKLAKADYRGLNVHPLSNGYLSADISGTGQGRGMGRVIYQVRNGVVNVVEVTLKHYKK